MTHNSSPTSRHWLKLFLKTGSALGLGLFVIAIFGLLYGQWWAKRHLAPMISQELTKSLKRPVNLGRIESIWLNEIKIDKTTIPAHGSDRNNVNIRQLVVNFDPVKLVFTHTLKLDIRAIAPLIYVSENQEGSWVTIPDRQQTPPGAIKIEVGNIQVDDGRVVVVPYGKNARSVDVSKVNLDAQVDDSQHQVDFKGIGQFEGNGHFQVRGTSLITNGTTQIAVKGQKVDAAAATRIFKIPQVEIARGTVDGELNLAIQPQKYLRINSKLFANNGKIIINNVPRSLDNINGQFQVSEREVNFNHVATKYDRVAGIVSGSINYHTGYQLTAQTAPIALSDIFKSLDLKSPFSLAGAAVGDLQLTGKLDRPILAGKFHNSQPSQVDRVRVDRVDGTFRLADGRIKLDATAQPTLGGKIATQGEIQLLKTPQTSFQVRGEDLPADALSLLYGAKLPPQVKLGTAGVVGTIGGAGANIYTNLRVDTPQATYPAITDLQITPLGKILVRGATIQAAGGQVNVTGEVNTTNWQLTARPQDLDTRKLATIAGLNLPAHYDGKLTGTIQAAGLSNSSELDRIQARGDLRLQLAAGQIIADRLTLDRGKWQANVSSNALNLHQLDRRLPRIIASGNLNLSGNGVKQINANNLVATGGGKVKLAAGTIQSQNLKIANGNWQGIFTTDNLQLSQVNPQVNGKLNGEFNLAGNLQKFTPESISGTGKGTLDLPQGKIVGNNLQIARGKWRGNLQASSLVIGDLAPTISAKYKNARLTGKATVAGDLKQLKPENITAKGNGKLSWDGGVVVADRMELSAGKWQGNFALDRLKLGSVSEAIPPGFTSARLSGNFAAAGDLVKFNPARLVASGAGELNLADGKIRATDLKLERGKWSSNLAIANLQLGKLNSQLSPQLQAGKLTGNFQVAGNLARLTPAAIQAHGSGKVKLSNGSEVAANNVQLESGRWQSNLAIRGLRLGDVNRDLATPIQAGLLFGNFQVAGNLQSPAIQQLQVNGNGNIQNVLGGKVVLDNLTLANGQWRSKVIAERLKIGELAKFAPNQSIDPNLLAGRLSANWQIGGNLQDNSPANLQLVGETKLADLRVGKLKFDPNLSGRIQANPGQGVDINFDGITDRLALSLDRNLQLQSFNIDRQGIVAKGSVVGGAAPDHRLLDIDVERFPLALLQLAIPQSAGIGQYRLDGSATGNLAVNLTNFQVAGKQLEITKPTFGAFQGDRLLANFRYANGQLNLDDTEIHRGANSYLINASVNPGATTPTFQAKLQVPKGNLEDVRNLLQIFSFEDLFKPLNQRKYGTVADLYTQTEKIANRPQPLYNELRRLSELRRWLNRESERQQATNSIPELRNLVGDFSGDISIASSPKAGLNANFHLSGEKWQLESYHLDRLQAVGNWRNGQLQLDPLTIVIKNTQMTLAGKFGADNQNGSINIQNFPADWFAKVMNLPVKVSGGIDLAAQINGNLGNPQLSGNLAINDAKLNRTQLQTAIGSFNYVDGRLNFNSSASFVKKLRPDERDDSIKIAGSIPYQLPFTLKSPASDRIKVDISLQDRGLQMLDVFSNNQLDWIDGRGKIAVAIDGKMNASGKFKSLAANGIATVANATIQSATIPEPVKNINGEIAFDFDRIDVRKLEGKLDRGRVSIAGIIPISDSFSIEPSKQLNVLLDGVAVNLKDKYNGDVNGKLTVLGTAFNPKLTGELNLSNGQIFIPESPDTTNSILGIKPTLSTEDDTPKDEKNNSVQLSKLQLLLGDNLQITRAPILNFIATGKLEIDGTLDNPRPFGQVQLQKGAVNLFTTQFRLASGPQTADFFPTLGTDPVLNLQLVSKVLESTSSPLSQRNSLTQTANNGEIDRPVDFYTTSLGSVETVQVEARIAGLASQLTQQLELKSTPARTQPEIVLLLGGGLVERISGDIGLGIVNLAGSNILNSIQDRISDLFSLSDFRLFTAITQDANRNSTFGIAAEVGTEITPKVSASVFKILTNTESLYYSLRYRLNDQLLLRGSTNLSGENRALVEFEQRF